MNAERKVARESETVALLGQQFTVKASGHHLSG
jgi:hypothetical protein